MFKLNTVFTDSRDLTQWYIESIEHTYKGQLFTVKGLNNNQYKRHYLEKLESIATDVKDDSHIETVNDSNVVFVDFKSKAILDNRETWLFCRKFL